MSDIRDVFDQSAYVPYNYPQLIKCKELSGCCSPCIPRCPKVPCYYKDHWCSTWGPYFRCKCPINPDYPPFSGVHEELSSMDYYTRIADNPNRKYPFPQFPSSRRYPTMAEKYLMEDIHDCPYVEPNFATLCPENRKEFNLLYKDTVCGTCAPPDREKRMSKPTPYECEEEDETSPEDMYDLPFRVCVGQPLKNTGESGAFSFRERIRSSWGVTSCIHPTPIRDLQTVSRANYINHYEMKTPKELKLYKSPPALDNKRPPVTIPTNPETDLVTRGPLCVNALPMVMRPLGKPKLPRNFGPKFEVIVQGPICI